MRNESFTEYDDFRPGTMEDIEIWEKSPDFDPVGMYIAEVEGKPVGRVQAHIDRKREEWEDLQQAWLDDPKSAVNHMALGMTMAQRREARLLNDQKSVPT